MFEGSSWGSALNIEGAFLKSLSCPSESFCAAVDLSRAIVYTAGTWHTRLASILAAPVGSSTGVLFIGVVLRRRGQRGQSRYIQRQLVEHAAGRNRQQRRPKRRVLYRNRAPTFCAAVDAKGGAVTYNGSTWGALVHVTGEGLAFSSVSCASASFCMAGAAKEGYLTQYHGSSWSPVTKIDASTSNRCRVRQRRSAWRWIILVTRWRTTGPLGARFLESTATASCRCRVRRCCDVSQWTFRVTKSHIRECPRPKAIDRQASPALPNKAKLSPRYMVNGLTVRPNTATNGNAVPVTAKAVRRSVVQADRATCSRVPMSGIRSG